MTRENAARDGVCGLGRKEHFLEPSGKELSAPECVACARALWLGWEELKTLFKKEGGSLFGFWFSNFKKKKIQPRRRKTKVSGFEVLVLTLVYAPLVLRNRGNKVICITYIYIYISKGKF